ncbi:phage major capsid protein [Mesorhizobium sp. IMUNJ 23232]|uniref:phage major capsid protein n=1 Tax=Mesorhizobium sp. IMUNJ 23232 TaxID=3376064 RepID=UPI00378CCCCB
MNLHYQSSHAGVHVALAHYLAKANGSPSVAAILAEQNHAPTPVVELLKAAVPAGTIGDAAWAGGLADLPGATTTFLQQLGGRSAFAALVDAGVLTRAPLRSRVGATATGIVAGAIEEGHARPVGKITLNGDSLTPRKVGALVVVSRDIVESQSAASQAFLSRVLRRSIAQAIDVGFYEALVTSGTTQFPSSGPGPDDIRADVQALLNAINDGQGRLAFVASVDVANAAVMVDDHHGGTSPEGLSEFFGLPFAVSSGLPAGTLVLLNGDKIAADIESIVLDVSRHGTVEMSDTPTNNAVTGTGAQQVSLWQTNSVGIAVTGIYGAAVGAPDALGILTDIEWGQEASS